MKFDQRCYELLKKIPRGRVTTYKEMARALKTKAYRAVGNAMNRNLDAPKIPCHRVVNSNGRLGGYNGGSKKKIELLRMEGIIVKRGKISDFETVLFKFK